MLNELSGEKGVLWITNNSVIMSSSLDGLQSRRTHKNYAGMMSCYENTLEKIKIVFL